MDTAAISDTPKDMLIKRLPSANSWFLISSGVPFVEDANFFMIQFNKFLGSLELISQGSPAKRATRCSFVSLGGPCSTIHCLISLMDGNLGDPLIVGLNFPFFPVCLSFFLVKPNLPFCNPIKLAGPSSLRNFRLAFSDIGATATFAKAPNVKILTVPTALSSFDVVESSNVPSIFFWLSCFFDAHNFSSADKQ